MSDVQEAPLASDTQAGNGLLHGVHMDCQPDPEFYVTQCGLAADPEEYRSGSDKPHCLDCWMPAPCRLCGEFLG